MTEKIWFRHYAEGVPRHIDYPEIPLFELLANSARKFPSRLCTRDGITDVTFQEMDFLSDQFAKRLVRLGINKGERIGIFLSNSPEFVLSFFSVLKAGGVVVAINPSYTANEIKHQVEETGIHKMFVSKDNYNRIMALQPMITIEALILLDIQNLLSSIDRNISFDKSHVENGPDVNQTGDIVSLTQYNIKLPEIKSDDIAVLQFTGGTTGTPKAAIGLHRNLVANVLQFRSWLPTLKEGEESILVAIPLFHVYGMVLGMGLAVALGATMILESNPRDIELLLTKIQKFKPTFFPGVPTLYDSINNFPKTRDYDLSSFKVCISGSAPLSTQIKQRFELISGATIYEGYGLSEAPTATHCNPVGGVDCIGSIGLPLPDVDCEIVDLVDGITPLPAGEIGELVIRGPQIMQGYHNQPDETKLVMKGGWLHTGDIAMMDDDGYFTIIERKKDLIKVGGTQVWPREVEEVIRGLPQIWDVAVAGIPDPHLGEGVVAWVVLRPGQQLGESFILEHCREFLVRYKCPSHIEFIESLPRNTVGKVLRRELARKYLESTQLEPGNRL